MTMIADPSGWELDEGYLDWEHSARWEGASYNAEEMVRTYDPRDEEEPMVWANNRPTTPAPVQEHLDTLYDYTLATSR